MIRKIGVYTETMAKVYAAQGHWEKAAEIYRYLLTGAPERKDLADALAEADKKIDKDSHMTPEQLVPLFREWIDLLLKTEELNRLKKLKKRFRGSGFRVQG